ncbi:hypothetical protein MTO96_045710 [Rhipicephalus appendiculatus]
MCKLNFQLKSWDCNASNSFFVKSPPSLHCVLAPAVCHSDLCDKTTATEMANRRRNSHKNSFLKVISADLLTIQRYGEKKFPVERISRVNRRMQCSQHAVLLKTPPCFLLSSHLLQHCALLQEWHLPHDPVNGVQLTKVLCSSQHDNFVVATLEIID